MEVGVLVRVHVVLHLAHGLGVHLLGRDALVRHHVVGHELVVEGQLLGAVRVVHGRVPVVHRRPVRRVVSMRPVRPVQGVLRALGWCCRRGVVRLRHAVHGRAVRAAMNAMGDAMNRGAVRGSVRDAVVGRRLGLWHAMRRVR